MILREYFVNTDFPPPHDMRDSDPLIEPTVRPPKKGRPRGLNLDATGHLLADALDASRDYTSAPPLAKSHHITIQKSTLTDPIHMETDIEASAECPTEKLTVTEDRTGPLASTTETATTVPQPTQGRKLRPPLNLSLSMPPPADQTETTTARKKPSPLQLSIGSEKTTASDGGFSVSHLRLSLDDADSTSYKSDATEDDASSCSAIPISTVEKTTVFNEQERLEALASHYFEKTTDEPFSEAPAITLPAVSTEGHRDLGRVSAYEVALVTTLARHIITTGALATLKDNQRLQVDDEFGTTHTFNVLRTGDGQTTLISPFLLGQGCFKEVPFAMSINPSSKEITPEAFAISPIKKMALYSRLKMRAGAIAEKLGADEVLQRMLQFRDSPYVAAPHFVVVNPGHQNYGGLLFPIMDKGSYEHIFRVLREELEQRPAQTNATILQLLHNSAAGVCDIHARKLVHGDIKPANLMGQTQPHGGIRGCVCDIDGLSSSKDFTNLMRTNKYLSPQAHGTMEESSYDWCKDDVWSLGMSYFEILTGKEFFSTVCHDTPEISLLLREDEEIEGFQDQIQEALENHLPISLTNRAEISLLIQSMLSFRGSTRPTMDTIRDQLLGLAATAA